MLNGVDEEQAQYFDALRAQAQFLVEMFRYRAADHEALTAHRRPHRRPIHPASARFFKVAQFKEFVTSLAADICTKVIGINGTACRLLQILAGLDGNDIAAHSGAV